MKKSAFTLIELLVVITIIAILAGIALPVFSGVQERARATQDANNLKQLGIATTAYFNDHDDTIFVSGSSYALCLYPQYLSVWKTFQSPFDKRPASELTASAPVSYDVNRNLVPNAPPSKSCSDVVSASNCIMLAPLLATPYPNITFNGKPGDQAALDMTSNSAGAAGGTHSRGKRINVLFQDAHVESMVLTDFHSSLSNSDSTSSISNIRWNK